MSYNEMPKIGKVNSPNDIDWRRPLKDQLEPQFRGGPDESKSFEELCMLRSNVPKVNDDTFQQIYPCDNIIHVTQKQVAGISSICVKQRHGSSMELIGSVYSSSP